jgi:hypothetical protein
MSVEDEIPMPVTQQPFAAKLDPAAIVNPGCSI